MTDPIAKAVHAMFPNATVITDASTTGAERFSEAETPSVEAMFLRYANFRRTVTRSSAVSDQTPAPTEELVSAEIEIPDPSHPTGKRRRRVIVDKISGRIVGTEG